MTTFVSVVHECFDGLAAANSMQCIEEREDHVRYGNDSVTFGVTWDRPRSKEVGIGFGLTSNRDHLLVELPEILRFQGLAAKADEIDPLRIQDDEDCRPALKKLADLTREYCSQFLAGDPETYASFAKHMDRRIAEYNAPILEAGAAIRALYRSADEAWKSHDYHKVIELYGQVTHPLPPFARERLVAAEKIVSDNRNKDQRIESRRTNTQ